MCPQRHEIFHAQERFEYVAPKRDSKSAMAWWDPKEIILVTFMLGMQSKDLVTGIKQWWIVVALAYLATKPIFQTMKEIAWRRLWLLEVIPNEVKITGKGYLLGYSTSSKAFRVYNKRTKMVEENMHIDFLEDQPNVAGTGPNWMFDLDFLTNTMNYINWYEKLRNDVALTRKDNIKMTEDETSLGMKNLRRRLLKK
ncbi:hypothetical protein Tco_0427565 [Tanacetum coccineum]